MNHKSPPPLFSAFLRWTEESSASLTLLSITLPLLSLLKHTHSLTPSASRAWAGCFLCLHCASLSRSDICAPPLPSRCFLFAFFPSTPFLTRGASLSKFLSCFFQDTKKGAVAEITGREDHYHKTGKRKWAVTCARGDWSQTAVAQQFLDVGNEKTTSEQSARRRTREKTETENL